MLGSLNGALPISLTIDSPVQVVGKQPIYRITNASPKAQTYWSSSKDGVSTGELRAAYGQTIEDNGSLEVVGGVWTDANVGRWRKEVEVPNADGSTSTAEVYFTVVPAQTTQAPVLNTQASFFSTPLFKLGGYDVTPLTVIGAGAALWFAKQMKIIK